MVVFRHRQPAKAASQFLSAGQLDEAESEAIMIALKVAVPILAAGGLLTGLVAGVASVGGAFFITSQVAKKRREKKARLAHKKPGQS